MVCVVVKSDESQMKVVRVVVSVAKLDVSVLCSGLCSQVTCKFCVVVSVAKLDVSVLCSGLCCQGRCKFFVVVSVPKSDVSSL